MNNVGWVDGLGAELMQSLCKILTPSIVITTSKAGHDNDFISDYQKLNHLLQTQFIHLSNPSVETLNTKGSVWRNRKLMNSMIKDERYEHILKEHELSQCLQLSLTVLLVLTQRSRRNQECNSKAPLTHASNYRYKANVRTVHTDQSRRGTYHVSLI